MSRAMSGTAMVATGAVVVSKIYDGWSWFQFFRRFWLRLPDSQTVSTAAAGISFTSAMLSFGVGLSTILSGRLGSPVPHHAPVTVSPSIRMNVSVTEANSPTSAQLRAKDEMMKYPKPAWLDTTRINLAVVGQTSVGKSSLVNFLRNVHPEDPTAATIGFEGCTRTPAPYAWSLLGQNFELFLWDCPGSQTDEWAVDYVQQIGLRYFDAVLVIVKGGYMDRGSDLLIQECLHFEIPLHLICSFVDTGLNAGIRNVKVQILHAFERIAARCPGVESQRCYMFTCIRAEFERHETFFGPELHRFMENLTEDIQRARLGEESD